MSTILALRALGLGDMYAAVPALRGLRGLARGARLVLAGPAAWGAVLRAHGVVDEVLPTYALDHALGWDGPSLELAVNLHGRGPQSHRLVFALLADRTLAFACPAMGFTEGPAWDNTEHEVDRWCRLVQSAGGTCSASDLRLPPPALTQSGLLPAAAQAVDGAVVVHVGAGAASRRWPVDRWAEVTTALVGDGSRVVLTGSPIERELTGVVTWACPEAVDLAGRLDAIGLAATVGAAGLVLSADTGIAHIATAYGTPSVTLFGPTPPGLWGPAIDLDRHFVLWKPDPSDPQGDPHGTMIDPRLARIGVDEVLAAARGLLPLRLQRN